ADRERGLLNSGIGGVAGEHDGDARKRHRRDAAAGCSLRVDADGRSSHGPVEIFVTMAVSQNWTNETTRPSLTSMKSASSMSTVAPDFTDVIFALPRTAARDPSTSSAVIS